MSDELSYAVIQNSAGLMDPNDIRRKSAEIISACLERTEVVKTQARILYHMDRLNLSWL